MPSLEDQFETACQNLKIPGAVLAATNKDGSFNYLKAFGVRSLEEGREKEPLTVDAIMAIASCTKLITAIACLQCVEKGLIGLDDDLSPHLPELTKLDVLTRGEDGKLTLKKRQNTMTLRHLLTHTSGVIYDQMSPLFEEWHTQNGLPAINPGTTILTRFGPEPLLFEPGTSWHYGASLDWAGFLVSRLTSQSLESYFQTHIFSPLGITDITFFPTRHNPATIQPRLTSMSMRDPTTAQLTPYTGPDFFGAMTEEMGGQGCYASMPSILQILQSILRDDSRLLTPDSAALLFQPQLTHGSPSHAALQSIFTSKAKSQIYIGDFPDDGAYNFGLGGILMDKDFECPSVLSSSDAGTVRWRRTGCLMWSGLPNLCWFVDREKGLCGIFGSQVFPPGDPPTKDMISLFDRGMYELLG